MSILESNKLTRFVDSFEGVTDGRKGSCNPQKCESLDGKTGAACCKLGYTCPFLGESKCNVYALRPRNCSTFPRTPEELLLVKGCGYFWDDED